MGHAILYCASCGNRIIERDMSRGTVVQADGQHYCPECRDQAPSHARAVEPVPSETPTELRRTPVTPARRHAPPPLAPASKVPLIVGGLVGLAAVVVAVLLFLPGSGTKRPPEPDPKAGAGATSGANSNVSSVKSDPFKEAKAAFEALKDFREKNAANPQAVIDRVQLDLAKLAGSPYETDARMFLREAEAAREKRKLEETVDGLLAKARDEGAKDPEFRARERVKGIYKEARFPAEKHSPTLSLKVLSAEQEYDKAFEKATRDAADPLVNEAVRLADQQKFDEALAALDRYPQHFRDTTEGRRVEEEKRRVRERKDQQDREARQQIARDFQAAHAALQRADEAGYKEASELFLKILKDLDDPEKVKFARLSRGQVTDIRRNASYNIACWYSRFVKDQPNTLKYLELSFQNGWSDWKHFDADADLDTFRKDAAFKDLVGKYRK
jgi:hypothetical protein